MHIHQVKQKQKSKQKFQFKLTSALSTVMEGDVSNKVYVTTTLGTPWTKDEDEGVSNLMVSMLLFRAASSSFCFTLLNSSAPSITTDPSSWVALGPGISGGGCASMTC